MMLLLLVCCGAPGCWPLFMMMRVGKKEEGEENNRIHILFKKRCVFNVMSDGSKEFRPKTILFYLKFKLGPCSQKGNLNPRIRNQLLYSSLGNLQKICTCNKLCVKIFRNPDFATLRSPPPS
jgi:hypothetical protein